MLFSYIFIPLYQTVSKFDAEKRRELDTINNRIRWVGLGLNEWVNGWIRTDTFTEGWRKEGRKEGQGEREGRKDAGREREVMCEWVGGYVSR